MTYLGEQFQKLFSLRSGLQVKGRQNLNGALLTESRRMERRRVGGAERLQDERSLFGGNARHEIFDAGVVGATVPPAPRGRQLIRHGVVVEQLICHGVVDEQQCLYIK